jgi:pimeloyl-ACP methyl ester carboxylesterase
MTPKQARFHPARYESQDKLMTTAIEVKVGRTRKSRWLRRVCLTLVSVVGIFAVLVGIFLWRPTSVVTAITRTYLWTKGVRWHDAQVNGNRIHFMAGGKGRPIVLIHGLGGRSDDWATVIPLLMTGGFTVYAPDLLGYGASNKPNVDYSIALETETVRQFLDQEKLEQVDLVGWSMGGWVALKLAAEHPEKVRTLTLVDSAGFTFNAPDPKVLRPQTRHELEKMAALFSPKSGSIPAFYARDILRVMAQQDWIVARALESMYSRQDLMDGKVAGATMPVLLLWGSKDVLTPLSAGYEMHRQLQQSTLSVIEGCGHVAIIECRDRAVPTILSFLQDY